MRLVVLISCMNQSDFGIVTRSKLQTDAVIINQCDKDCVDELDFVNSKNEKCHVKMISTTERGLSRSRNLAIENSWGDICLICDDDEVLSEGYEDTILSAYNTYKDYECITFHVVRKDRPFSSKQIGNVRHVGFKGIMQTSSVQITFRRETIVGENIKFDVKLGSGTGNGSGEENKFLLDIRRKSIKILYYPQTIATVLPGESLWFKGFNDVYMRNLGWSSRRSLGSILGFIYISYFGLKHINLYRSEISPLCAFSNLFKGYFEQR